MTRTAAAAAAAALTATALGGCGAGDPRAPTVAKHRVPPADALHAGLAWAGAPVVFTPEGLPRDRILSGALRNDSRRPVELRVDRVTVLDADGHALRSNVRFVAAFGHGLYGPGGPPAPLRASRYDQRRLGERVTLEPGRQRPVTVAWRLPRAGTHAERVRVSGYTLTIPRG